MLPKRKSCYFKTLRTGLRQNQAILIVFNYSISYCILGQIIWLITFKTVLIMSFYNKVTQYMFANWEKKIIMLECRSHLRNSLRPNGNCFLKNQELMIFKRMVSLLSCDPILLVKDFFFLTFFFDGCAWEENLHKFPVRQFGSVVVAAKLDFGLRNWRMESYQ